MYDYTNLFEGYRFAWYGQRALDCVGLDRYMDFDLIMSCDFGLDTPAIVQWQNSQIYSVEAETYKRENWTSAYLDQILDQRGDEIKSRLRELASPVYVIAYSATRSLARFARLHKSRMCVIAPDHKLKAWLDDKIRFAKALRELKLPSVHNQVSQLGSIRFAQIKRDFGLPFVLRLPLGSAGSGTFFIHSEADLEKIYCVAEDSRVLVSKYIDGVSLNVNAAVLGDQTVVAFPSVQLVGLKECSNRPEVYCGNDYSSARLLPQGIIDKTRDCALQVGAWLSGLGYQGMFGMDLMVDLDKAAVYPVDLNPRFQNSTHLLTQGEIISGRLPLAVLNIAWQLGLLQKDDIRQWQLASMTPPEGAQIIIHSLADSLTIVNGNLASGIYVNRTNGIGIVKLREGISLLDPVVGKEVVISCAVPRPGTIVVPGAPLLKIFSRLSVFDLDSGHLYPWIRQICKLVYDQLKLQPTHNEA